MATKKITKKVSTKKPAASARKTTSKKKSTARATKPRRASAQRAAATPPLPPPLRPEVGETFDLCQGIGPLRWSDTEQELRAYMKRERRQALSERGGYLIIEPARPIVVAERIPFAINASYHRELKRFSSVCLTFFFSFLDEEYCDDWEGVAGEIEEWLHTLKCVYSGNSRMQSDPDKGGVLSSLGEGDYDFFQGPCGVDVSVSVVFDPPECTIILSPPLPARDESRLFTTARMVLDAVREAGFLSIDVPERGLLSLEALSEEPFDPRRVSAVLSPLHEELSAIRLVNNGPLAALCHLLSILVAAFSQKPTHARQSALDPFRRSAIEALVALGDTWEDATARVAQLLDKA